MTGMVFTWRESNPYGETVYHRGPGVAARQANDRFGHKRSWWKHCTFCLELVQRRNLDLDSRHRPDDAPDAVLDLVVPRGRPSEGTMETLERAEAQAAAAYKRRQSEKANDDRG